jgi:hypothetical protein
MPLFETAANPNPVTAEALINISPGLFNNLACGDVVFVSFEEGAIEKPIVLGKLYRGADIEGNIHGGAAILDTLKVRSTATLPASTLFEFQPNILDSYKNLNTPKKVADYIKWLEKLTKSCLARLEEHFTCFKNWTQWQLRPENIEIDDGDLDTQAELSKPFLYQKEDSECKVCTITSCPKSVKNKPARRNYLAVPIDKNYPDI